jgi:opacity protein-like surface antigen
MKNKFTGALCLALASGVVSAEEHWFVGVDFGKSRATKWNANVEEVKDQTPNLAPPIPSPPTATSDDSSSGHLIHVGYRFGTFALEGFYADLGEFTGSLRSPILLPHIGLDLKAEYKAYGLAAVGFLPVGENFELFGKVGVGNLTEKVTATITGGLAISSPSDSSSATALLLGLGMAVKFGSASAITLSYQNFSFDRQGSGSESINLTTLGFRQGF